jgi:hypothetical protein
MTYVILLMVETMKGWKAKRVLWIVLLTTCIMLISSVPLHEFSKESSAQVSGVPEWLVIDGLVQNALNLSYAELRNFPQISEVANLSCITPRYNVMYNWTGVPLFYLLSMAKVISGGYREVIFNGSDGYAQGVLLETAMDPTSILALYGNGTDLELLSGFGNLYRVAFPCRWGYKWVERVVRITVVDYVYGGANPALIPNCTKPITQPPMESFNLTASGEYAVQALSNASIVSFNYDPGSRFSFNVTGAEESEAYFYITFSVTAFSGRPNWPYVVFVNQNETGYLQTAVNDSVYLYFEYSQSLNPTAIAVSPLGAGINGGGGARLYMQ